MLVASADLGKLLSGKYLLLDTDFLSEVYENPELLKFFLGFAEHSFLMREDMVVFEFLRDVFLPEYMIKKEEFIDKEIFNPTNNHPDIFRKLQKNALLLSKIYAHKGKAKNISNTDLFLAARMMLLPKNSLLITGNRKDYPACIFELEGVINTENTKNETIRSFVALKFNNDKFTQCYRELLKLKIK